MTSKIPLLRIKNLRKSFQGLVATDHVTLDVHQGDIHALIGPNGAGKSTLVNLISGHLAADGGSIELGGHRLETLPAHARVRAGMSRCFQVTSIFKDISVLDNLRLAVQAGQPHPLRTWQTRDANTELTDRALGLASDVGLEHVTAKVAGILPHGAQRQLDVALALAAQPRLLVLDEPMAGMGPDESERMTELIHRLRQRMTILLIEHDMDAVFRLADCISVLVRGKLLATGCTDEIRHNADVQSAYLGTEVMA